MGRQRRRGVGAASRMKKDFLVEIVRERTRANADFPDLVREADARRKVALATSPDALSPRQEQGLSTALESLRAGNGVPHDEARERLPRRGRP